jgi:hypothetical protein
MHDRFARPDRQRIEPLLKSQMMKTEVVFFDLCENKFVVRICDAQQLPVLPQERAGREFLPGKVRFRNPGESRLEVPALDQQRRPGIRAEPDFHILPGSGLKPGNPLVLRTGQGRGWPGLAAGRIAGDSVRSQPLNQPGKPRIDLHGRAAERLGMRDGALPGSFGERLDLEPVGEGRCFRRPFRRVEEKAEQ